MFYKGNTSCIRRKYKLYSPRIHFVFAVNTLPKQQCLKANPAVVTILNSVFWVVL